MDGCINIFVVGNKRQPPDSLFKGRQQSTGHLRLIAWRSTANTGVYLPLLTSSPNEHTFRGHRLPKNEKKTLSRSTADEGYQVSRRRDIAVPRLKTNAPSYDHPHLLLLTAATNHHHISYHHAWVGGRSLRDFRRLPHSVITMMVLAVRDETPIILYNNTCLKHPLWRVCWCLLPSRRQRRFGIFTGPGYGILTVFPFAQTSFSL